MKKKIITMLALVVFAGGLFAAINRDEAMRLRPELRVKPAPVIEDHQMNGFSKDATFTSDLSGSIDKAGLGLGWNLGDQRRIQAYYPVGFEEDPIGNPPVLSGTYRKLWGSGYGTIGGAMVEWGADFNAFGQAIYEYSPHVEDNPGGRYPTTVGFINGWSFGLFNDFWGGGGALSEPYFTVGDVNWGWDGSYFVPIRMMADPLDDETAIPGAWLGVGDAIFDPVLEQYHVVSIWEHNNLGTGQYAMVAGHSDEFISIEDLWDETKWHFTDYRNMPIFDTVDQESGITGTTGLIQVAMAKDIHGYGNGYGIAFGLYDDVTYAPTNVAGDSLDYGFHWRPGYMYTTDFGKTWHTPEMANDNLFPADDIYKLFSWYGEIDTIGEGEDAEDFPINWPFIYHNIDVAMDIDNNIFVVMKVFPYSTETADYWFPYGDEGVRAGYYLIRGKLGAEGATWEDASFIATMGGWFNEDRTAFQLDFSGQYVNDTNVSIGLAGNGVVYVGWPDRPEDGAVASGLGQKYHMNGFFTYSPDWGKTWSHGEVFNAGSEEDPWHWYYAWDITNDPRIHDEGWTVAKIGRNIGGDTHMGTMTVFAGFQNYDPDNLEVDDGSEYWHYQQFLRVAKITGSPTGIEVEQMSLTKDFNLYQNYPNPFNPNTEIKFSLMNDSDVRLTVFNIKGETVMNLKNERMAKGVHTVNFDASSLNSGVYFYQLNVGGRAETKKMVLMK